jgi:hypothetical protein
MFEVIAYLCLLFIFFSMVLVLINDTADKAPVKWTAFTLIAIPTVYYGLELIVF